MFLTTAFDLRNSVNFTKSTPFVLAVSCLGIVEFLVEFFIISVSASRNYIINEDFTS